MKIILKEHIPLIVLTIVQLSIILLVYWLEGFSSISVMFYVVFLCVCLFVGYLIYRYLSHRSFYSILSNPPETMNEMQKNDDLTVLTEALENLLEAQYRNYQYQLRKWEKKQQDQLNFMNQWVHQMKTPLSVIELIAQDADDERIDSIAEETDRLKNGLEMALYVARLETFEQDFIVERVSLLTVIESVIDENKRYFIRNNVYPEVKVNTDLEVETDKKWLRFILNQLFSNAIKYSAGSKENIKISAFSREREVILEVKDSGVGIVASDLPRVFQPFYTGENGRKFKESTGMGLYLTHEVCKKLNHNITLESEVGKGTTVQVVFPSRYSR